MAGKWVRHGVLNSLEHLSTRGLDALTTIAVLWFIPTEKFSILALAQAYVAPALFLFISPETVFYPKFAEWQAEGDSRLRRRLRFLRRFSWAKIAFAIVLSAFVAKLFSPPAGSNADYADRFFAMVWAFSLPVTAQVAGADREFLRLSLRLRELNLVTLSQRIVYLGLLLLAVRFYDAQFWALSLVGILTAVATALIARSFAENTFSHSVEVESRGQDIRFMALIRESLRDFSTWNHIAGVIIGWIQNLDLFFLGLVGIPARQIGTYSVVLKIANFALSLPVALANLYLIRLGRTPPRTLPERHLETAQLTKFTAWLAGVAVTGGAFLWLMAPWGISVLSRGRWTPEEQVKMIEWLGGILPATVLFGSLLLWTGWLSLRASYRSLVYQVYVPWGIIGCAFYLFASQSGGPDWTAWANIPVIASLIPLLMVFTLRRRSITFQDGGVHGSKS